MAGYLVTALCPHCPPARPNPDCLDCGGTGEVAAESASRSLTPPAGEPCRLCGGRGRLADAPCLRCGGSGALAPRREVSP